jgi:hypothetical protein
MRLHEFVNLKEDGGASSGATSSGSIATVSMPIGGMISRNGGSFFSGTKYTTDNATPNTPAEYKKYKRKKK